MRTTAVNLVDLIESKRLPEPKGPLADFVRRLTDPEDLGWGCSMEVRQQARLALSKQKDLERIECDDLGGRGCASIYIAGPMTGLPEYNYPAFMAAAQALRSRGWRVTNPAEKALKADADWVLHMRADLALLVRCDALALLPGWEKSRGARLEVGVARELGMSVHCIGVWLSRLSATGRLMDAPPCSPQPHQPRRVDALEGLKVTLEPSF